MLRELGVPGVVYLPTAYVGTGKLPWWDQIAYIVKWSTLSRILVAYPEKRSFRIDGQHCLPAIRALLDLYKSAITTDSDFFIDELAKSCGTVRMTEMADPCFLTWDEARTMQAAGLSFGSHTHTHRLLGKLTYEEQVEELSASRSILERELGGTMDTVAYPVGSITAFNSTTLKAAHKTRYKVGFSFYGGVNRLGSISPLNVLRVHSGQGGSEEMFRLRMAMLAVNGRDILTKFDTPAAAPAPTVEKTVALVRG